MSSPTTIGDPDTRSSRVWPKEPGMTTSYPTTYKHFSVPETNSSHPELCANALRSEDQGRWENEQEKGCYVWAEGEFGSPLPIPKEPPNEAPSEHQFRVVPKWPTPIVVQLSKNILHSSLMVQNLSILYRFKHRWAMKQAFFRSMVRSWNR